MTRSEPALPAARRTRAPVSSSSSSPHLGITIYGCGQDEAPVFREVAPRLGVVPAITEAPVSAANVELARGNRCAPSRPIPQAPAVPPRSPLAATPSSASSARDSNTSCHPPARAENLASAHSRVARRQICLDQGTPAHIAQIRIRSFQHHRRQAIYPARDPCGKSVGKSSPDFPAATRIPPPRRPPPAPQIPSTFAPAPDSAPQKS